MFICVAVPPTPSALAPLHLDRSNSDGRIMRTENVRRRSTSDYLRRTYVPDALVAAMPHREASAPGSIGNQRPDSRRWLLRVLRETPGSTMQSRSVWLTARIRFMRVKFTQTPPLTKEVVSTRARLNRNGTRRREWGSCERKYLGCVHTALKARARPKRNHWDAFMTAKARDGTHLHQSRLGESETGESESLTGYLTAIRPCLSEAVPCVTHPPEVAPPEQCSSARQRRQVADRCDRTRLGRFARRWLEPEPHACHTCTCRMFLLRTGRTRKGGCGGGIWIIDSNLGYVGGTDDRGKRIAYRNRHDGQGPS